MGRKSKVPGPEVLVSVDAKHGERIFIGEAGCFMEMLVTIPGLQFLKNCGERDGGREGS